MLFSCTFKQIGYYKRVIGNPCLVANGDASFAFTINRLLVSV